MEDEVLIHKIKSLYIIKNIFNYIQDKNYEYKLFLYSKKFQKKLEINYIEFKVKYLEKMGFDLAQYLYIEPISFRKNFLTNKFDNFLIRKNLNKEKVENIIYNFIENQKIKDIDEEELDKIINYEQKINIDSPLFKIIAKSKNFDKNFTIHMSQEIIDKYYLKDYYIKEFNDLNNLNVKYNSIFYNLDIKDINKIKYLNEFNIDFNKIKRITLNIKDNNELIDDNIIQKNNKIFFETLFSFNNIINNLIYLNINFINNYKINSDLFENINKFKLLRYLYLENCNFDKDCTIKLNTLRILSIQRCENILTIPVIPQEKLEILDLSYNKLNNIDILEDVNMKNLKQLNLSYNKIDNINILEKVNFKELLKLDLTYNVFNNINVLEKADFKKLKELNLSDNNNYNSIDISVLEKVDFKELEKLYLFHNRISDISVLEKVNFKELIILDLNGNKISDINVFENVDFQKLEKLYLNNNQISDINILEKVDFKHLKELNLYRNRISTIQILEKVNFKELIILNLSDNQISDINVLGYVIFPELKELNISKNKISDINVLEKVYFKKLIKLDLNENQISDIQVLEKVNFKKLEILNLN